MVATTEFSDSYEITNTNSCFTDPSIELSALQLVSNCLESVFNSPQDFYSDAKLVLPDGQEVPFHRCILSARTPVFRSALAEHKSKSTIVKLQLKEIATDYQVSYHSVVSVLAYVYCGRVRPPPKGAFACLDHGCSHLTCRPALDFLLELLYLAFVFRIPQLVTLSERHFLDILDRIVIEDLLVVFRLANICGATYKKLFDSCIDIIVKSDIELVSLGKSLPQHVVKHIRDLRKQLGLEPPELDKHVSNIHKALQSDDVELVKMLLTEGHVNLDDAYALHFAVAHCDVKTASDLIDLDIADVNLRNPRGYTVLHVAAMRNEPKLIVYLLTKGANDSETTFDGRTALVIAKRLTKAADSDTSTVQGISSLNGRLCVEVLEHASKLDPLPREVLPSFSVPPEELRMRLLYLENRVALARLLFPVEAQVVMDIAKLEGTCEFTASSLEADHHTGAKRASLDLNMAPFRIREEHLCRLRALMKTVELGKRYFPRCSLDHFMDTEDLNHLASVEEDTPEKRLQKKQRYIELQETLMTTFREDKEEPRKSSSSKSMVAVRSNGKPSHRRLRVEKKRACGKGNGKSCSVLLPRLK